MTIAVLALVTDAFGGRGGIAQYNRDFLTAIAETPAHFITVLPRHAPDKAEPPLFTIRQARPRPNPVTYTVTALATAFTRKVDVVFCGHIHLVTLATVIARLKGAKLIVQTHGIDAWSRPSRLRRAAFESADLVLCVSRYTRARVLDWAAIAPERVLVVPNTVSEAFQPGEGASLRATYGFGNERILLTVGRMDSRERYKGQDRVIAAILKLLADGHDIAYVIVGDGDDRPRLEKLAQETGVGERVHFVSAVEPKNLIELYRMADLFVMPSSGEGFGISFLEAMASGTPALGLDAAGARDALADGELGAIVFEADLSGAISRLLKERKPVQRELAAAVRARFGRDAFTANVRHLIERLFSASLSPFAVPKAL